MLFLNKKAVGLDIADKTIEVIELEKGIKGYSISGKQRLEIEEGVLEKGRIKNEAALIKLVKKVLAEAKPNSISSKEIIFGLPENLVFTHIFSLPKNLKGKSNIKNKINEELVKIIPLERENYEISYRIINSSKGQQVLTVATEKKVLWEWKDFFKKCNLSVNFFDLETLAVFRSLSTGNLKAPVCVLDLGEATTSVSIFNNNGLVYSYFIPEAGDKFTKDISVELGTSYEQAEEMKINNGLSENNQQVKKILEKSLNSIINEVNISFTFYEEKFGEKISEVALVGGSSKMIGFFDFAKEHIKKPLEMGKNRLLKDQEAFNYLGAMGLALKGIESGWQNRDPEFEIEKIKELPKEKVLESLPASEDKVAPKEPVDDEEIKKKIDDLSASQSKIRKQLILLVVVLLVGAIAISFAVWFRNKDRSQRSEELGASTTAYTQTQILDLQIPVFVGGSENLGDRASGRIIKKTINSAPSYEGAVNSAFSQANNSLRIGEELSTEPISSSFTGESLIFPLEVSWLAFNKKEADSLFIKKIQAINKDNIPYILNSITTTTAEPTDNPNVYLLNGEITIFTDQII